MRQVYGYTVSAAACWAVFIGALDKNGFLVHCILGNSQALLLRIHNIQECVKSPEKPKYKETCQQGLT